MWSWRSGDFYGSPRDEKSGPVFRPRERFYPYYLSAPKCGDLERRPSIGELSMLRCFRCSHAMTLSSLTTPGVEPGLSRPRRDVLTTRRCGLGDPVISTDLLEMRNADQFFGPMSASTPTTFRPPSVETWSVDQASGSCPCSDASGVPAQRLSPA